MIIDTKNIKNIIFDLGGVILNIDYAKTSSAFKKLALATFDELYSQIKQNTLFDDLEKGKVTPEEFIREIKSLMPPSVSKEEIINAWNAMLLDLPENRITLLKQVNKNYSIFLLSNTNQIHYDCYIDYIRKTYDLNFDTLFEQAFYSHHIGHRKPDKECFEYVCNKANIVPSETLFIDDSIQHVEGAKKFGINEFKLKTGFKQLFQNTIGKYIDERKMKLACELLETSENSIQDIAFEVGYEHYNNFILAFKKRFQMTPLQYRKQNQMMLKV